VYRTVNPDYAANHIRPEPVATPNLAAHYPDDLSIDDLGASFSPASSKARRTAMDDERLGVSIERFEVRRRQVLI